MDTKQVGKALGPILALIVWFTPLDLAPHAHNLLGIIALVIVWWVTEALPLPVTGLFGVTLAIVVGVANTKEALAPFAHPLIFLFMGGYFIAKSMSIHGLDKRIALYILTRPGIHGRPKPTLIALLGVTAFLSMWISNTATAAMLLPISLGVLNAVIPKDTKSQGILLIAVAYAANIGGIATPVGSTPNILSIGMLNELAQIKFTFMSWVALAFPTMLACLGVLVLLTFYRIPKLPKKLNTTFLDKEYKSLGPLKLGEKNTLISFSTAVILWTGPGLMSVLLGNDHQLVLWLKEHFPTAPSALLAACLLFILPVKNKPTLEWKDAATIDWSSLILFGGGLSIGLMIFKTGLGNIIGDNLAALSGEGFGLWVFMAASIFAAIFFTETTSNTATANMLLPIIIATCQQTGINPMLPTVGVALACSLAFMMPVSTPPNAILFSSGKIKINQMISQGFLMNITCGIIILLSLAITNFLS